MRLAAKMTLALCVVLLSGLMAQSLVSQQQVLSVHQREAADDLRILTRALSAAASELWAVASEEAARAYLDTADVRRANTHIAILGPDAGELDEPFHRSGHLVLREAVVVSGKPVAVIEVAKSFEIERQYIDQLRGTQIWTTFLLLLACVVVTLLLGMWLIARPIHQLVTHARQIGEGLHPKMEEARQRDEIGRLAREMKSMADKLRAASTKASSERRAHAAVLQQLRHADRLSTVGKLASSIAHEMGTPLNVVSGRAKMIAAGSLDADAIRNSAQTITEQADRLSSIIEDLLQFARRETTSGTKTNVHEVLDHAKTLIEPLTDASNVRIEVARAPDVEADIDEGKTLQILTNLLVNAAQAMPDGGTITIAAGTEHVESPPDRRAKPGDYVRLTVADEGIGIPEEDLDQVFEAFFTTKRAGQGTGLGLSVCQGIVRDHGGWIHVDSEVGKGTTFSVYIPREDKQ